MNYRVVVPQKLLRVLDELPADDRQRVAHAIDALGSNPRPPGTKKLTARTQWRIRVGNIRVFYSIFDGDREVIVDRIVRRATHTYD